MDVYMNLEGVESWEENDEESVSEDENVDSDKEYKDLFWYFLKKIINMVCIFDESVNDVVTVLFNSDDVILDLDYIYDGDVYLVELDVIDDS